MASSSSARSLLCPRWKYDVFLSFRGEDTRKTFTSHLYQGLKSRGVFVFHDDKRLEHGASISEELLKAIQESQLVVIIFSMNYATSTWCLDELVKIMECKDEYTVIPVFYDVDPSTIRNQNDSFADAFDKHESRYKVDDIEGMQKVKRWRAALTAAANLSGFDIRNRIESDCILQIVDRISSRLCKTSLYHLKDVVGINSHLEKIKSLLKIEEISEPRIVGIWGMGGIGKTTIARAIFDTLSHQFEVACFLADVKEHKHGLHSLQNILLSELLREKDNYVNNKEDGKRLMASRLRLKKVLVVLDDIDHNDHLDYLAGDLSWFGNGSRIIVTTRDSHLIENDVIYEVPTLPDHEARQLFDLHAFKKKVRDEQFEKLSLEVVDHAKGLPLALKVWGSFLYMRDITVWTSAVKQMKNTCNSKIVDKLKISYNGLEPSQQKIFLDIACFLRGREKKEIMPILDSCDFEAHIGLDILIEKSLVFISEEDTIEMHDLIQDMGKYVVNMQKDMGEPSRLWLTEEFEEVIINNMGNNAMEAIWLVWPHKNLSFSKDAMTNMKRLRILYIHTLSFKAFNCHEGLIEYLSNNLRWFVWDQYPWKSLPANFEPRKLAHLELHCSSLCLFQTRTKHFPSLWKLDLSQSKSLIKTPDFREMPNLKYLCLNHCDSLDEVHDSLGICNKLIWLDLSDCGSLKRFPCVNMESLEYLNLDNCSKLEIFPEILGKIKEDLLIDIARAGIKELNLNKLCSLVALPSSICRLKSLVELDVSFCKLLESLPNELGDLENLEKLDACNTLISRPPPSIIRLNKLKFLSFANGLRYTKVYFVFPPMAEGLRSLEKLNLRYCNLVDGGLPEDIGCLSSLKDLDLCGNKFEHLPQSIGQLGALRFLDLSDCRWLKELPVFMGMRNLETLDLSYCNLSDGDLLEDIGCLSSLKKLDLTGNSFEHLPQSIAQLGALRSLSLTYCRSLTQLPKSIGQLGALQYFDLSRCERLTQLPESIGQLGALQYFDLSRCERLTQLPESIAQLGALRFLNLTRCERLTQLPELPPELNVLLVDYHMALKSIHILATKKLWWIICRPPYDEDGYSNLFAQTLFQYISSLQHDTSASDRLSRRVFTYEGPMKSFSCFHHQGRDESVSINLPENWHECNNFLGVAVCYSGSLVKTTAQLIPVCNDGMIRELSLCNHSEFYGAHGTHFFLVPRTGLWDTSKENGETPKDYGLIRLSFSGKKKQFGLRLLYKDELELEAMLQMRENNEHNDSGTNEASCSSSRKQRSRSNIHWRLVRLFRNFVLSCKPKILA